MNKIKIQRKVPLVERPIFIDGISRAGKFFLGKIISGFENVEYFQSVAALEHIPLLERLGGVSEDAAISLLQMYVDEHAYYMRIGRNLNFRYDDLSSVANSLEADQYLRRSLANIGGNIVEEIKNDGRRSMFVLHETLPNIGIFFKTFPDLRWINLIRHPVDIIHSWYLRGWGHRFGADVLAFVPVVEGRKCPIPWFAVEWEEEYRAMSEIDRIIRSIAVLMTKAQESYLALTHEQKDQICTVTYENIITSTYDELKKIESLLKSPISQRMSVILARERCPKNLDPGQRARKMDEIKVIASKEMYNVMMAMALDYENNNFWGKRA